MSVFFYFSETNLVTVRVPGLTEFIELRGKPIYGGVFGFGEWALCACQYHDTTLPEFRYLVVHATTGTPITATFETKALALRSARSFLSSVDQTALASALSSFAARGRAFNEKLNEEKRKRASEDEQQQIAFKRHKITKHTKRRGEIFSVSNGRCFYCQAELKMGGEWHIEHKTPRSRGGSEDVSNLVAACSPCNWKKRNRTAEEFSALVEQSTSGKVRAVK